jgi:hypothetical protein
MVVRSVDCKMQCSRGWHGQAQSLIERWPPPQTALGEGNMKCQYDNSGGFTSLDPPLVLRNALVIQTVSLLGNKSNDPVTLDPLRAALLSGGCWESFI